MSAFGIDFKYPILFTDYTRYFYFLPTLISVTRHGGRSITNVLVHCFFRSVTRKNIIENVDIFWMTRQVTRAMHARNRVCPRVELILKILIIIIANYISWIY